MTKPTIINEVLVLNKNTEKVEEAIKKRKAKWKAERTSLSELSVDEQRKMLGLLPTDQELKKIKRKKLDHER